MHDSDYGIGTVNGIDSEISHISAGIGIWIVKIKLSWNRNWNQGLRPLNRNQRILAGIGIGVESENFFWNRNQNRNQNLQNAGIGIGIGIGIKTYLEPCITDHNNKCLSIHAFLGGGGQNVSSSVVLSTRLVFLTGNQLHFLVHVKTEMSFEYLKRVPFISYFLSHLKDWKTEIAQRELEFVSDSICIKKYTVNGVRLQANVASAVLTFIYRECSCSVPKINTQCILCWCLKKQTIKQTNKQTKTLGEI